MSAIHSNSISELKKLGLRKACVVELNGVIDQSLCC